MIVVTQDLVFSLKKLAKCILSEHYVQEQQNKVLKNCIYVKTINYKKTVKKNCIYVKTINYKKTVKKIVFMLRQLTKK